MFWTTKIFLKNRWKRFGKIYRFQNQVNFTWNESTSYLLNWKRLFIIMADNTDWKQFVKLFTNKLYITEVITDSNQWICKSSSQSVLISWDSIFLLLLLFIPFISFEYYIKYFWFVLQMIYCFPATTLGMKRRNCFEILWYSFHYYTCFIILAIFLLFNYWSFAR